MAGVTGKMSTGLTGLAVARNPRQSLKVLYEKILRTLQKMPEDAAYRTNTQLIVEERYNVIKTEHSVEKIEAKINAGQAEELMQQAEQELSLARKMLEWKPWEPLVAEPPRNQWKWPHV